MAEITSATIQSCFNNGEIYKGCQIAQRHIGEYGVENSQLEVYLLAKGLYAVGEYFEAIYWITKTKADPKNRIVLEERIRRMLPAG